MKTNELYKKGKEIVQSMTNAALIAIIIVNTAIGSNALVITEANALPKIVSDGVPIEELYPVNNLIKEHGKYVTKDGIIKTDLVLPETTIESSDLVRVISMYNDEDYTYSNTSYSLPDGLTDDQKELYNRIANINTDEMYLALHSEEGEEDLVDYALDELGVIFDQNSNSTPYGVWYYNNIDDSYNFCGEAWCAMFASFNLSKINPNLPMYAAVSEGAKKCQEEASKGNGEWHWSGDYIPKRNDIFFNYTGDSSHTGIVMASDGEYIYTIEGNTSDDDKNYIEGCVNTKRRPISCIYGGYYTPPIKSNENGLNKSETFISEKANTLSY